VINGDVIAGIALPEDRRNILAVMMGEKIKE